MRLIWLGSSLGQSPGQLSRLSPPSRRLSTGLITDGRRSSSNSAPFVARSSILRPNVTLSPRRVDGVRGPATTTTGRRISQRGASPSPRRTAIRAKGRGKGLTVTLSLSLRPTLRPKPLLRRLVWPRYDGYWTMHALSICPRIGMPSPRSGLSSPPTTSVLWVALGGSCPRLELARCRSTAMSMGRGGLCVCLTFSTSLIRLSTLSLLVSSSATDACSS